MRWGVAALVVAAAFFAIVGPCEVWGFTVEGVVRSDVHVLGPSAYDAPSNLIFSFGLDPAITTGSPLVLQRFNFSAPANSSHEFAEKGLPNGYVCMCVSDLVFFFHSLFLCAG